MEEYIMTPNLYTFINQTCDFEFEFGIVCEANLGKQINQSDGVFVAPFDISKIVVCQHTQQLIFFTCFNPPTEDDIPNSPFYFSGMLTVCDGQEIEEIGGDKLAWVKVSGQWCTYDYDNYLEFTELLKTEPDLTLFDFANIQQTVL